MSLFKSKPAQFYLYGKAVNVHPEESSLNNCHRSCSCLGKAGFQERYGLSSESETSKSAGRCRVLNEVGKRPFSGDWDAAPAGSPVGPFTWALD